MERWLETLLLALLLVVGTSAYFLFNRYVNVAIFAVVVTVLAFKSTRY
jgi:hypothetical protein